jgi:hypothetical protein
MRHPVGMLGALNIAGSSGDVCRELTFAATKHFYIKKPGFFNPGF